MIIVEHQPRPCENRRKSWPPFWGEFRKGVSLDMKMFRQNQQTSTVTTTIETWKIIPGLCRIPLPYMIFSFSLSSQRGRLSFHTLFLFSRQQLKRVVANKLLYLQTKRVFVCSSLFLTSRLSRSPTWHLRYSAKRINLFDMRWWKCLLVEVIQTFIETVSVQVSIWTS